MMHVMKDKIKVIYPSREEDFASCQLWMRSRNHKGILIRLTL